MNGHNKDTWKMGGEDLAMHEDQSTEIAALRGCLWQFARAPPSWTAAYYFRNTRDDEVGDVVCLPKTHSIGGVCKVAMSPKFYHVISKEKVPMLPEKVSYRALTAVLVVAFCFAVASTVNADFVSAITNGGFETNDLVSSATFDNTVNGWGQHDYDGTDSKAGIWNMTRLAELGLVSGSGDSFPTNFSGAATLALTTSSYSAGDLGTRVSWVYQSLGTVGAADIGLKYTLSANAGARTNDAVSDITMAFAAGASASSLGSALGSGTIRLSGVLTGPLQMSGFSADYIPTSAQIGQEVFAVISVTDVAFNTQLGSHQCVIDGVSLASSPIPEPSALSLLGIAVFGLICYAWRKRK